MPCACSLKLSWRSGQGPATRSACTGCSDWIATVRPRGSGAVAVADGRAMKAAVAEWSPVRAMLHEVRRRPTAVEQHPGASLPDADRPTTGAASSAVPDEEPPPVVDVEVPPPMPPEPGRVAVAAPPVGLRPRDAASPDVQLPPSALVDEADHPPSEPVAETPTLRQERTSPLGPQLLAIDSSRLDGVRGGFIGEGGLQISFGIERAVYINGNLVTTTSLNLSDLGKLSAKQGGRCPASNRGPASR